MKKILTIYSTLLLIPLLGSCGNKNMLTPPIGTLHDNELVWLPHEDADSYEVIVRKEKNILVREHYDKDDTLKFSPKEYRSLPFGNLEIELIAKKDKKRGSMLFPYIESTIHNLHVNENSYSRTGLAFQYYHHGIEFQLGTTIPLKEIETMKLTGTTEEMAEQYENIKALYASFLSETNVATRNTLAKTIGNDLIVTYYYYDENDIPVHFYTKQKYWTQYLNVLDPESGEYDYFGETTGYFNTSILPGTYRTAVNLNPNTIDFVPLSEKELFTDVIIIKDGIIASETTSVLLEKYEEQTIIESQKSDNNFTKKLD